MLSISLKLSNTPPSLAVNTALTNVMSRFSKHLQCLAVADFLISTSTFAELATLPSLRKFSGRIEDGSDLVKAISSGVSKPFTALQTLILGVNDLSSSSVAALLKAITSPQLERISISFMEQSSPQDLKLLFEAATSHRRLESFGVCMSGQWDDFQDRPDTEVVDIEILRPLLRLSLQVLRISDIAVRLNSEDIPEVARALPSVRVLVLESKGNQIPASPPTLRDLVHFAKHCPSIEILDIWVDATDVDTDETRPGMGHEGKSLTNWTPGWSPISQPECVAAFLSDVFPNVQIVQPWEYRPYLNKAVVKMWYDVAGWVVFLAKIRKQERRDHYKV